MHAQYVMHMENFPSKQAIGDFRFYLPAVEWSRDGITLVLNYKYMKHILSEGKLSF